MPICAEPSHDSGCVPRYWNVVFPAASSASTNECSASLVHTRLEFSSPSVTTTKITLSASSAFLRVSLIVSASASNKAVPPVGRRPLNRPLSMLAIGRPIMDLSTLVLNSVNEKTYSTSSLDFSISTNVLKPLAVSNQPCSMEPEKSCRKLTSTCGLVVISLLMVISIFSNRFFELVLPVCSICQVLALDSISEYAECVRYRCIADRFVCSTGTASSSTKNSKTA